MPRTVFQTTVGASPVIALGLGLWGVASTKAFDMARNTNLAVYWGQNSYGATNPINVAAWQQPIEYYCAYVFPSSQRIRSFISQRTQDDTIDTLPIAFLTQFYSTGNLPTIDLANTCSTVNDTIFPGTNLPDCTFLATGIETCQHAGKIVTLSIGGSAGDVGFASDAAGRAYAQVIWDVFLGGNCSTRPFGTAVLDGIDLDIEGGSQTGYVAFLTALRALMDGGDKRYYITAAPQCPFPDAYMGTTLNAFPFDAVYVQFYNNYCGLLEYSDVDDWDFGTWDDWAKTISPNPNVKVYVGALASPSIGSGYVDAPTLAGILGQTRARYASFGGAMLWDASQAYANGRYDVAVKNALVGSGGASTSTTITTTTTIATRTPKTTTARRTSASAVTTTTTTTTTTKPSTQPTPPCARPCDNVSPWSSNLVYVDGDQVVYADQLWVARWWTEDSMPGGPDDVWKRVGSC